MQTVQKYPNCPLRNIYKTYPPASWPHAFSCAHVCQNIYNESGRLAKCKNVIYIADSFIENPTDDFSKWVQNQKDVLFLGNNNTMPTTISLFSMTMHLNISCRCQVNTRLNQPYRQKNLKQVSEHTLQNLVIKSNCFLLIITWRRIWATALKVV
jgi:hypothetical protein